MKMRKISLKWQMIWIFLFCWFVPILLMIGVMGYYISGNHRESTEKNLVEQLVFSDQNCIERLNNAIASSRKLSYDDTIRSAYTEYRRNRSTYSSLYSAAGKFVDTNYRNDRNLMSVILWFTEAPKEKFYSIYNTAAGGTYRMAGEYWSMDHEKIAEIAEQLDVAIGLVELDGRMYMVRNLMIYPYSHVATLVMRLNLNYSLGNLNNLPWSSALTLHLNDQIMVLKGDALDAEALGIDLKEDGSGAKRIDGKSYIYHSVNAGDYRIAAVMEASEEAMLGPFYGYQLVIIGMVVLLLPLLFLLIRTFQKQVSEPVAQLISGTKEIEGGNLGYQLSYDADNREFKQLVDSINRMSDKLQYQFERIYREELALRDARITALQAHITPHFLNNTLELINWEARLSGDVKVPKMIEALSTVLNAAMDRKKKPQVHLSEEMVYVNAYLHIVQERLGKRLVVKKELDEKLMDYFVPRLILQPIIENAVDHGAVRNGYGTIVIRSRKEGNYIFLEVENDGTMSAEDEARIARLLAPDYDRSREEGGNLGIANVHQRLRILYGETCGLTITRKGDHAVLACLRIAVSDNEQ